METELPLVIVRKETKDYGTSRLIEGRLEAGERVTLIEDVLTTGGEALRAAEKVRQAGGEVLALIAVLDREEGAAEAIRDAGLDFRPLFRRSELPIG
jgi:orotate phosphoribosyltransferase